MDKRIVIDIGLDGEVSIEALGFSGPACEAATKAIEEALGQVTDRTKKAEYYASTTQVRQHAGGSRQPPHGSSRGLPAWSGTESARRRSCSILSRGARSAGYREADRDGDRCAGRRGA